MLNFEKTVLVTKKKMSKQLKKNQRVAKRKERGKRLFDRKTKIYKVLLCEEKPIDLVGEEKFDPPLELPPLNDSKLLQLLKDREIKGMSGNGFPAYRKLGNFLFSKKENSMLVVNAVECDPALVHDDWLSVHCWEDILLGIRILAAACRFSKIVFVSRRKMRVPNDLGIHFKTVSCRHPNGEEHYLLQDALKISIPRTETPAQSKILVYNVQTVIMIGRAAMGLSTDYRYLTLADFETGRATVCKVPYRYPIAKLLGENCQSVDSGAMPFYGVSAFDAQPVTTSSTVAPETNFVGLARRLNFADPTKCVGCGACREKCPLALPVDGYMRAFDYRRPIPAEIVTKCIACGACTYFCKADVDVMHLILSARCGR